MKYLIIPLRFFFEFSYAVEEEITSWFNQESEKFLEIMNTLMVRIVKNMMNM